VGADEKNRQHSGTATALSTITLKHLACEKQSCARNLYEVKSGAGKDTINILDTCVANRMYGHILVAIDESDTSDLALRDAIHLAKDQNAVLRLVHVVDLTPVYLTVETPYPYVEYQKAMEETGGKILASRATTVREAGIEVDSKLITIKMLGETIYDVIQEQSKQWPADLIVIGTHGRRGFQHARLGSVAEGLMRLATKPALVIRGPKQEA
jgi:nucleotide-binding universal stress UspA family protein